MSNTAKVSVSKRKLLLAFISITLVCSLASGSIMFVIAQGGSTPITISSGIYPGAPTYTIYTDGSTYYAKNAYGVVSYSSTNAAITINAALAVSDVVKLNGGTLPFTYYDISSPIILHNRNKLVGDTDASVVIRANNLPIAIESLGTSVTSQYAISLENLQIYGNDYPNSIGLVLNYTFSSTFLRHVSISHFGTGLFLYGSYGNTYSGCSINYNVDAVVAYDSHASKFEGCTIYQNTNGYTLHNCVVSIIENGDIEYNSGTGITITDNPPYDSSGIIIDRNYIEGNGIDIVDYSLGLKVTNNYINGLSTASYSIKIYGDGAVIDKNTFGNYNSADIFLQSNSTETQITNNQQLTSEDLYLKSSGATLKLHGNEPFQTDFQGLFTFHNVSSVQVPHNLGTSPNYCQITFVNSEDTSGFVTAGLSVSYSWSIWNASHITIYTSVVGNFTGSYDVRYIP
jgi:parallel beta-helix repeat protein